LEYIWHTAQRSTSLATTMLQTRAAVGATHALVRRGLAAQLAGLCSGPHEPPQDVVVVPKVVIGAGNRVLARVGCIQ
jgi:hypothetical protein